MRSVAGPVMRRLRLQTACLIILCVTVSFPRTSLACSCGGTWTPVDADVIFRGTVVRVHDPVLRRLRPRGPHVITRVLWGLWYDAAKVFDSDVRTVFEVESAWKGHPAQFVTVNTGSGLCCNCTFGNLFMEREEYLLYATRDGGELGVGSCAGVVIVGKAAIDAEAVLLGPGVKPTPGPRGIPTSWRALLLPSAMATPFMLALLIWLWRISTRSSTQYCAVRGTCTTPPCLRRR
jgi:hypothetical protein